MEESDNLSDTQCITGLKLNFKILYWTQSKTLSHTFQLLKSLQQHYYILALLHHSLHQLK